MPLEEAYFNEGLKMSQFHYNSKGLEIGTISWRPTLHRGPARTALLAPLIPFC